MGFFLGSNHSKIEYNSNQSKNGVKKIKTHLMLNLKVLKFEILLV